MTPRIGTSWVLIPRLPRGGPISLVEAARLERGVIPPVRRSHPCATSPSAPTPSAATGQSHGDPHVARRLWAGQIAARNTALGRSLAKVLQHPEGSGSLSAIPSSPGTDRGLLPTTLPAGHIAAPNPQSPMLVRIRLATPRVRRRYGVGLALRVPFAQTAVPQCQVAGPDAVNRIGA